MMLFQTIGWFNNLITSLLFKICVKNRNSFLSILCKEFCDSVSFGLLIPEIVALKTHSAIMFRLNLKHKFFFIFTALSSD